MTADGVISEDLRKALARRSVICTADTPDTEVGTPSSPEPVPTTPSEPTGSNAVIQKTNIIAGVRTTTAGIPDDTAVFTYLISFNHDGVLYVPTNPDTAFAIDVMKSSGTSVSVAGVDSIISSAQKVLRADGTSYFQVENGDTMSLRTSIQPGAGSYYAKLGRLSYTTENAITVVNPAMINYGFDDVTWKSETVTLLN